MWRTCPDLELEELSQDLRKDSRQRSGPPPGTEPSCSAVETRDRTSRGSLGKIHIGISGWRYKGWRGVFYPEKLPQRRELEFASRQFDTIELNGSFYSLQRPESFSRWHAETPQEFTFSIKGLSLSNSYAPPARVSKGR